MLQLQDLWKSVMTFWLDRGVDGFIVRRLDEFYMSSSSTMSLILNDWRSVLNGHSDKYNRKVWAGHGVHWADVRNTDTYCGLLDVAV